LCSFMFLFCFFFFSSRRRHTRFSRDWSSDVCSSDLYLVGADAAFSAHAGDLVGAVIKAAIVAGDIDLFEFNLGRTDIVTAINDGGADHYRHKNFHVGADVNRPAFYWLIAGEG